MYVSNFAEEPAGRKYDELMDIPQLIGRMEEFLMDHNAMSKRPMNLAVFLYAVEHISRIARWATCQARKDPPACSIECA